MQQGGHARAVFVDPTGRRHRRVARTAWVLAALGVAYVALVVVSLLLPPSLARLTVPGLGQVLPGPAAAPLGQAEGEAEGPDVLLERSPSAAPGRQSPTPRPSRGRATSSARPAPAAPAASSPSAAAGTPAAVPTPGEATPAPAPTRGATAAPSEPPGRSAAPGQASRSPKPRPTSTRGPR